MGAIIIKSVSEATDGTIQIFVEDDEMLQALVSIDYSFTLIIHTNVSTSYGTAR